MPGPTKQDGGYKWDGKERDVFCQECGACMLVYVAADTIRKGLNSGEYMAGTRYTKSKNSDGGFHFDSQDGIFGVCQKCARNDRAKLDLRGAEVATQAQHKRIMDRLAEIRKRHPQMPLEEAVTRATDDEFEPENEPNFELRRYLMERMERDDYSPERDRIARGILTFPLPVEEPTADPGDIWNG